MEDEKTKRINNNEVIFFLGAGASVKAGVPVTRKFVKKFEERINRNENGKKEALTWLFFPMDAPLTVCFVRIGSIKT